MELVFWASVVLLLHTYFFYPLILVLLDSARQMVANARYLKNGFDRRRRDLEPYNPPVSLVVAAYNEEDCIQAKLDNSLSIDYPDDRFEVLIGSDGSTDRTEPMVAGCPDPRVRLSAAPRGGKVSVLNRCIPSAMGDIVVLTDANTVIDRNAIRLLVRHFKDPQVGAVCGRLRLYNRKKKEYEESTYWAYESLIKFYEGKHGAVLGANGGLYAIRKSLFEALPPDTVVDDFVIPLRLLDRGYKVIYEPEAVAFEETTEDYGREFGRRARIAAGNFQSLRMVPGVLNPARGFVAFAFWSHKVLRWVAPMLMGLALLANAALLASPAYQVLFALQLAFYALAYLGKGTQL
ncbi:MAG: glycosyltransferase family 2 protein, partial [Myxococcales bacterium]